jgi:hypothetical protein
VPVATVDQKLEEMRVGRSCPVNETMHVNPSNTNWFRLSENTERKPIDWNRLHTSRLQVERLSYQPIAFKKQPFGKQLYPSNRE